MTEVTSNSTNCAAVTAPVVLSAVPLITGALFQFVVLSVHGVEVPFKSFETKYTPPPSLLEPVAVTVKRNLALRTDPGNPVTSNFM